MICATNNIGKLEEIRSIFNDDDIKGLADIGIDIDIEENGSTFYDNALNKAKTIYELIHIPTIADDSGLCVDILSGFPGVMTHRFLGNNASDNERNMALINKMKDYIGDDREALTPTHGTETYLS